MQNISAIQNQTLKKVNVYLLTFEGYRSNRKGSCKTHHSLWRMSARRLTASSGIMLVVVYFNICTAHIHKFFLLSHTIWFYAMKQSRQVNKFISSKVWHVNHTEAHACTDSGRMHKFSSNQRTCTGTSTHKPLYAATCKLQTAHKQEGKAEPLELGALTETWGARNLF